MAPLIGASSSVIVKTDGSFAAIVLLLTIMGLPSLFKYFVKLHDEEEDTDLRNTHRQRQRSKNNPSNAQTNVLRKSSWVFRKREDRGGRFRT